MSINRKGNLILFTGSSGVGKGTIIKEKYPSFGFKHNKRTERGRD